MTLQPGATVGPYAVVSLIGEGGMGEVYLAEDRRLRRRVALKILPPGFVSSSDRRARFEHEARAAASLNHPNVCTIFDVGEADGQPFIAMEYCEGTTIAARLHERPLTVPVVLDLALQIADGLDEAHNRRIIHRDIKSANLLVTPRGQVKILDFGIAKELPAAVDDEATRTATAVNSNGIVMGTVAYMSPEQALGRTLDARSDLFSFGVVLYEMLTGRIPFGGRTASEQIDAIVHHDPPALTRYNDQVPEALVDLVRRMLQKDPQRRTQSAREVWNALHDIRETLGRTQQPTAADLAVRNRPSGIGRLVPTLALMIAVGAGGVWLWHTLTTRPAAPAASGSRRLVVLPASVIAPAQLSVAYAYLADAVPRTLFANLRDVQGLEMPSPPNTVQVGQLHGDLGKLMSAYDATLYLESDITADKTQLAWNVRLVEWPSRTTIWKKSFPGQEATYLSLVQQAADEIHGALVPDRREGLRVTAAAGSSEVELQFQDGVFYSRLYQSKGDPNDFARAYAALTQVFTADPTRAEAAAEVSLLLARKVSYAGRADTLQPEAKTWAEKAVQANDRCGACWVAASYAERLGQSANPRKQFEYALKAAARGPDQARTHAALGIALSGVGAGPTPSLEASRAAARADPLNFPALNNVGYMLYLLGRDQEALSQIDRLLSLEPNHAFGQLSRIPILADLGRIDEAAVMLRQVESMTGDNQPVTWLPTMRAVIQLGRGDTAGGATTLAQIIAAIKKSGDFSLAAEQAENLAPSLLRRGRIDDVFALLNLAVEHGANPSYEWLMLNPQLAKLRADRRFAPVAAAARKQFDSVVEFIDLARRRGETPAYLDAPMAEMLKRLPR